MPPFLASIDLDALPQLGLGTAVLLIFVVCASLAVLRGLLRILAGSLVLCLSAVAAYFAWRHAPLIDLPYGSWIAPAAAAIAAFIILRALLRFAVKPLGESNDGVAEANKRSPLRWLATTVFSLIPAALLTFTGASAVNSFGSIEEIRRFADGDKKDGGRLAFLTGWKDAIANWVPEDLLLRVNPLGDDARVTLAKLIALGDGKAPPKAIPILEEPQIRELILNDPRLRRLAREGRYGDILRDPRLDRVMADPDLRKMLAGLQL